MTTPHLVDDLERALAAERPAELSRRDVPQELLVRAAVPTLLKLALQEWALIALAWLGMLLSPWFLYPLWAALVAARLHALGVILHDAAHLPLRRHGPGLRLLEGLAGYPIATTVAAMRYHHIRHHRDSGMPSDPYFKGALRGRPVKYVLNVLRGFLLIPFWTVRPWIGLLAVALPSVRTFYGRVFLQDRSRTDLRDSAEVVACGRAELGQLVFQSLVIALAFVRPDLVVWGYFVPVVFTGLLAAWRLINEHTDDEAKDRTPATIVATTHDDVPGPLGRLFLTPRNIGHHIVHHLHPQVSLTALPELRRWYLDHHPGYPRR